MKSLHNYICHTLSFVKGTSSWDWLLDIILVVSTRQWRERSGRWDRQRVSSNLPSTFLLQAAAFLTATLYPGIVFGIGFFVNLFIWGKHSSGAIPFTTMLAVAAMWFGISLPLVYLGYYFGYRCGTDGSSFLSKLAKLFLLFRKQPYEHPVRTNQIPRQVPTQVWRESSNHFLRWR